MWPMPVTGFETEEELAQTRRDIPFYALKGELGRRYNVDNVFNHQQATYVGSAGSIADCEKLNPYSVPEVSFIGRSNSGKSKLVNAILGRKYCQSFKSTG